MISLVKVIQSKTGRIIVSILLGLGLATLFRKVCNERNCLVFRPPDMDELRKNTYKYNNKCYQFKEKAMKCNPIKQIISL
jgi:hypothetical protein